MPIPAEATSAFLVNLRVLLSNQVLVQKLACTPNVGTISYVTLLSNISGENRGLWRDFTQLKATDFPIDAIETIVKETPDNR